MNEDLVIMANNTLHELESLDNRGPTHEWNKQWNNMRFIVKSPCRWGRRQDEHLLENANKFLLARRMARLRNR